MSTLMRTSMMSGNERDILNARMRVMRREGRIVLVDDWPDQNGFNTNILVEWNDKKYAIKMLNGETIEIKERKDLHV